MEKNMKATNLILAIILLATFAGCKQTNQNNDLITVDVSKSYPQKELLLQDFMDVEYIPLETTDEFITQGFVRSVGKNILLVTNRIIDGDIFVFDRKTGKGLRKINRFGQSGEEYTQINEIVLDEEKNELFVVNYTARKILVYDLNGNFNRSFNFVDTSHYIHTFNYDRDNLICFKSYSPSVENEQAKHILISKQDGVITHEIQITVKQNESPVWMKDEAVITPSFCLTALCQDNWLLTRTSSDTVYTYSPDKTIHPFMTRTPSIHTMEPQVFLFPTVITEQYVFMQALKKEFDLERMKGFPVTDLLYDKQEKAIFEYSIYNDDFINKKSVYFGSNSISREIAQHQLLQSSDLVEAYKKGELKGKLKEIASELEEEDNPVIMLIKHKK
jgi:hypothetical protein